ncbi:MAG: succinate CoA transferase [Propionibacteriaceae bacterium]|nr:succinate CoA transferase [Propionibacteriaceae bacterium]
MTGNNARISHPGFAAKLCTGAQAAAMIEPGDTVGVSGFAGSGHPKVVPIALAERIGQAHDRGEDFQINLLSVATAAELDSALVAVDGIKLRMPYQSVAAMRNQINAGKIGFTDTHLSHVSSQVTAGMFGPLNIAIVEVAAIDPDGTLLPSSSIGISKTWLDQADKIILEVNSAQPDGFRGFHDVYYGPTSPPNLEPIPLTHPKERIGVPYLKCSLDKVIAVVETDIAEQTPDFRPPDADSQKIGNFISEFLAHEVKQGRLPKTLLPLQSGIGNIANAVLAAIDAAGWKGLTAHTELVQDYMLQMLRTGTLAFASSTAFTVSATAQQELFNNLDYYRERVILRPAEVTNHPEVVRRLGCLSMNGLIEADIYGNVNSTHVMGTKMQNGIGGAGDFARNAYITFFTTPSIAKGGAISTIVPMVSHVDHTEHDVHVLVTEQGLADLRGLPPRQRARKIIDVCAHPDYRDALNDYFERASASGAGLHTPHILPEALSWHGRFLESGTMRA